MGQTACARHEQGGLKWGAGKITTYDRKYRTKPKYKTKPKDMIHIRATTVPSVLSRRTKYVGNSSLLPSSTAWRGILGERDALVKDKQRRSTCSLTQIVQTGL